MQLSKVNFKMLTDMQKIGIGLTGFGVLFLFLGMLLFFDSGLLGIGNVLFISGISLIIGLQNAFHFFFQPNTRKIKGTACFFGGILLIFWLSAIIGMALEMVGLYYLFGDFMPIVIGFARRIPGINVIFMIPVVSKVADRVSGATLPM